MAQVFVTGKPRRDPINHRRELSPPPIRVYAMGRGDRGQFWSLHKPRTLPRSPPLPVKTRQTTTVTNYGCSTSSTRVEGWLISVPPTEPGMTCVRADCLRCDYTVLRNGDRSADCAPKQRVDQRCRQKHRGINYRTAQRIVEAAERRRR